MYAPATHPRPFQPIPASGVRVLCGMLVLWLTALALPQALVLPTPLSPGAPPTVAATPNLQSLPLAFTPNLGQTDPAVRFFVRGATGNLFFTPDEVVLTLPQASAVSAMAQPDGHRAAALIETTSGARVPLVALRTRFEGANPQALVGAAQLPGVASELVGGATWGTAQATYGAIVYEQLYPGIDLRYHGVSDRLSAVYSVAAGTDPATIRWHYDGPRAVRLDGATGALQISIGERALTAPAPRAWQMIEGRRVPVEVRYQLHGSAPAAGVGFALGSYNPGVALTIEPAVEHTLHLFSTFMGGSGTDMGTLLALDLAGNIYVSGATTSLDFPVKNAVQGTHAGGGQDGFIVKLSPDGQTVLYSSYFGGSGADTSYALAVDPQGYAYVAGFTNSPNFPAINAAQGTFGGGRVDGFVVKLSPDGGTVIYSSYLGGSGNDVGFTLAADQAGAAYVSGFTTSTDLPLANARQSTLNSANGDIYIAKFGPEGERVYSTYLGGTGYDETNGVAVDDAGYAYVVGFTSSPDFPLVNAAQPTFDGVGDIFVLKLTPDGQDLVYSTYLGGTGNDLGTGIAIDSAGQAVITGATVTRNYPTVKAYQAASHGSWDAIVTRLSADGRTILYSSYLGGSGPDFGFRPAVGRDGGIYLTGRTTSANFPKRNALQRTFAGGESDAFITRFSPDGQRMTFSSYLGGKGADEGASIVVDHMGGVYVAGRTGSADFPLKNAVQSQYAGGDRDMFVTKIGGACVQLNPAQFCRKGFQR